MKTILRLVAAGFFSAVIFSGCAPRGPLYYPEIAAHRGDRQAGADNSKQAIAAGLAHEFPYLEIDVRYTKDKAMVLAHDKTVRQRYFEGALIPDDTPVAEATLGELRAAPLKNGGGPVLVIEDALKMVAGSNSEFLLDIKVRDPVMLANIVAAAEALHAYPNLVVQCQSVEIAKYVRDHYPALKILARANSPEEVSPYSPYHPEIVQIDSEWASPEVVNRIRAEGAKVLIKAVDYSYDNPSGWRMLKRQGADIVLTDYPEELSEVSESGLSPKRSKSISAAF